MNIKKKKDAGTLNVIISGRIDTSTAPELDESVNQNLDDVNELILDFKDVNYVSSAGLRVLLSLHKKMSAKGGMVVKNVNETNMEIFDFTGFADILNIE